MERKKKKFKELKEKYNFIHRFKFENSDFLNAILNGEWVLLDGIENAPSSIIEKITLLCGDKPELNLFEIGEKPIYPKEGFHIFMTYNPDRTNHNAPIPSILLDKCLIYNLESFIDNQNAISQIIYGFLVNSNYSNDIDFLSNISSKLSNIHFKISNELENESVKINERIFINFCKNIKLMIESKNSFPLTIKNNYLYFYFPSNDKEKYDKLINNIINETGNNFVPLANNFRIICKKPLELLKLKFDMNIGNFIFCCLDTPFQYLNNIKEEINKFISEMEEEKNKNKIIYLPLMNFSNLLNSLIISFNQKENSINKKLIREEIDFEIVRTLLLFEKLNQKKLITWDCIDILYKNNNLFKNILNLIKEQNLINLEMFFDIISSNENIKYINDIINIFPYNIIYKTKFYLLNEILLIIIKNAAIKNINFEIKLLEKKYYFKFDGKDNEIINISLDLNLNNGNELIITNKTQVILTFENKKVMIPPIKSDEPLTINKFFLLLIEQVLNTQKFDGGIIRKILKEILFKLDDNNNSEKIKIRFKFDNLFKTENNIIVNIWSILYLSDEVIRYILLILRGIEKEICELFINIKNSLIADENFYNQIYLIISLSIDLTYIIKRNGFLFNLFHERNYISKVKSKSISEQKKIQRDLKIEINAINNYIIVKYDTFPTLKEKFINYNRLLEEKNLEITKEIDKLEFLDFKQRVTNKIKNGFSSESLKNNLLRVLEFKKEYKEVKELDLLIDNYLSKYQRQSFEKKIIIFSEKENINEILNEEQLNKNEQLIEILLKYSEIKDLINEYFSNNQDKFISLQKLNERIDKNYIDFFNSFLLQKNDDNKEKIYSFLDSIFIHKIIVYDLTNNFIELKSLFNNLYDGKNFGKISERWCKNIEKQYNLTRNIYFPNLNANSFLNFYIRIKNDSMDKVKGFFIESNEKYEIVELELIEKIYKVLKNIYSDLLTKNLEKLIQEISKLLLKLIIDEEKNKFAEIIESIRNYIDLNQNDEQKKFQIQILKDFLKVQELYSKYDKEEKLLFDDLNQNEDKKDLFTSNYPSLINYFNCNPNIYKLLISEPEIFNYKVTENKLPLWLICVRTFANTNNIKPFFELYDDIIIKFEEEFKLQILEKLKNNYNDIFWIILISNNNNKFLSNKYYERLFRFFNFLLYELTLLNPESQNKFYILIRNFIFNIFNTAYEKGDNYILTSTEIEIFKLNNNLFKFIEESSEQKFNNFYNSIAMKNFKYIVEEALKNNQESLKFLIDKLKDETKKFEKQYIVEYIKRKAEEDFTNAEDVCKKYNLLIDKCTNNNNAQEDMLIFKRLKFNDIKNLIDKKDAVEIDGNELFPKVACIEKGEFMKKHIKIHKNEKFEFFTKITHEQIKDEFKPLIEKIKKVKEMIISLDKNNISELKKVNVLIKIIEEKDELLHQHKECDKDIVEKISDKYNIDINIIINKISEHLKTIKEYIQYVIHDYNIYEEEKDIYYLEYINRFSCAFVPNENKLRSIPNNNDEYFIIKNKENIIPYITIRNNKIIGFDKINYDLGILNLNSSELQYVYFAILDENIELKILKTGNDVDIITRNKLYFFKVKINEKKSEKLEKYITQGAFQLNYNGSTKIINYEISYQLESIKVYLKCDKYKLKYISKSVFQLNTSILFQNEEIYFTVKNFVESGMEPNNLKVILKTFDNNNCIMPIKNINNNGFSLIIKSDKNTEVNTFLSCSVTVIVCQRFQFEIKINSIVKPLDFEFLISQNKKRGFLNEQIYCSFENHNEFDFILYTGIQQNRVCEVNFESEYDNDLLEISELKSKDVFFNFKQNILHIKLFKKVETIIKLKAIIDTTVKEIKIIFTSDKELQNNCYKYPNNDFKNYETDFFCFSLNELSAHGLKRKERPIFLINKNKNNIGYQNIDQINNTENLNLREIDTHINKNINGICDFYNRMSEEARILPIYCLNCQNEKQQKLIRKNYHILEEIYCGLIPGDEEINYTFYEENFFYEEIREFIESFEYLNSIIQIKDKYLDKKIDIIKRELKENKHKIKNYKALQWIYEKIIGFNNIRKLREYMQKNGISLDDFDINDLDEMQLTKKKNDSQKIENTNIDKKMEGLKSVKDNNINNSDIIDKNNINNTDINNRELNNHDTLTKIESYINKALNNSPEKQKENEDIPQIVKRSSNSKEKNKDIKSEINIEKNIEKNIEESNKIIPQNESSTVEEKGNEEINEKINSIMESSGIENENKNHLNKIMKTIKEKNSMFMRQDIWKQNENKESVKALSKMTINDYAENILKNKIQRNVDLINNTQLNSLQEIKKERKLNKKNSNNIQNGINLNQKEESEEKNIKETLKVINLRKDVFIPEKNLLNDKRHEFENDLKNGEDSDPLNESQEIKQFVRNNEIKVFTPSQRKEKFIEKKFEDDKNYKIKFQISFENNDTYFDEFDDELVNKIISNIKEKDNEDKSYKIETESPIVPNNRNKKQEEKEYIIKELLSFSKIYMEKFLETISKADITFETTSFCFIIDCSLYLGYKVKLFNLMIILSIIKVLNMIDMQFSILLSADDKYKIIIKNYNEHFDYEDLIEMLYESIIIKRYRNNILKALVTSIHDLKNQNGNTIYLTFSDCMDESFTYPNYWIENILADESNHFILILEKSRLYKEMNEEIINKMINSFEEKINKGCLSKIKIINMNFSEPDINSKIFSLFSDILNMLNISAKLISKKHNPDSSTIISNNNKRTMNIKIDEEEELLILLKKDLKYFESIYKDDVYRKYDKIYFINNEKKKLKFSESFDKKEDIIIPKYTNNYHSETDFFSLFNNYSPDRTLIDSIFYPNKATRKQLSTKGTEIDIEALILYTLTPAQEPKFYLEDKGGLIRNYSITVIIDNSKSCFDELNERHSFQTLINLFHIINSMAIPSFDLIVTTKEGSQSNILLFDKPSVIIFKNESIFEELLKFLSNPVHNTDIAEALKIVYELKRKKKNDRDSYVFILTDGLCHKNNELEIMHYSNLCQNLGIKIFGVGIGIFPYKAQYLFDTFIYAANPTNLLKAISKIFGKIIKTENELDLIKDNRTFGNLEEIFNKMEANNKFYFEELRKELLDVEKGDDVYDIFSNSEKNIQDEISFVEKGVNLEIYKKNILKTQKILMVMFWSFELNKKNESIYISPKYINNPSEANDDVCIDIAIKHFGVETEIVLDYESAIKKLLEKNEKGECNYYSVWIFCGPQYAVFPPINGEKNTSNPNLVEEFINVLIEFWNNGGALIFMAEGDPLNFQVNLFLEKIDFSKNEKVNFRIRGDYKGDKYLHQDREGKMDRPCIFNKSRQTINSNGKEIKRQSLSHNLGQIYEGVTISYAVDEQNNKIPFNEAEKLLPFKPYAINSEGGISTLIYETDDKDRGDIIIDCGYTKCFLKMHSTGTYQFIQNIAGWTARPEIKNQPEKQIYPWNWRPKGINYKVNYDAVYNGYLPLLNEKSDLSNMKTLFCIDDSYSTNEKNFYYNEVENIINLYYKKDRGDIFYLWNENKQKITYEELETKIKSKIGLGGTYPQLIADIIEEEKSNECKHLIIITDGNVGISEISEADEKVKSINYSFDFVSVYILGDDGDLSIGSPFCRATPNKTFKKRGPEDKYTELITLSIEDIETLQNLENYNNYDHFINDYDKIYNAVQAKCIGTSDPNLKEKLEKMFKNIIENNSDNIDMNLLNQKKDILIRMTEGSIKNAFTLDQIKAANCDNEIEQHNIQNYRRNIMNSINFNPMNIFNILNKIKNINNSSDIGGLNDFENLSNEKNESMKRIKEELAEINNNPIESISVNTIEEDNIFEWKCSLIGPKDTPYSDGVFTLMIRFPDDYPNTTPEVIFTTPIYHINVNPLNDTEQGGKPLGSLSIPSLNMWNPENKIKDVLFDAYSLFYKEDILNPFGIDRVEELKSNRALYEEKIRHFTKKFASTNTINTQFEEGWDFTYP